MASRIILHAGTGGSGTTAVAAATALGCAAAGQRTLLIGASGLHDSGDLLGVVLGPEPTPVSERLWALEVSPRAELERRWDGMPEWMAFGPVLPGLGEIAAGLVLADTTADDRWDVVILDGGPAGEALRLLALPEVARSWLARLAPAHRHVLKAPGSLTATVLEAGSAGDETLASAGRVARVLAGLDDVLHDPERCTARLVLAPARGPAALRRAAALLGLHGVVLDAVVLLPPAGEPRAVRAALAPVPVLEAPALPASRGGLDRFGQELWAGREAAAVLYAGVGPELVVSGGGASLRLELPHAERAELALHRVGGALVVSLGEHRRSVALPPAVSDYRPAGARFTDGALHVDLLPPTP